MIAVQGPNARAKFWQVRPATKAATEGLGAFFAAAVGDLFVARTGYTGEDGFEVMLPAGAGGRRCGPTSRPRAWPKPGSARATRCAWKRA